MTRSTAVLRSRGASPFQKRDGFITPQLLHSLVDGIASYADDDSFYKFLSYRNEGLDRYGFGSASSDIAYAVRVRTKAKSPTLFETIFELECDSKRRWITCNGRCNPPVLEKEVRSLPEPASLPELATDILLDSIVPQDPHRLENAVRGISWGGLHVRGIINRVCVALPTIDPFGRTLLEKVLDRWMRVCPEEDDILNCLYGIFDALTRADEACVLSFATREPGIILKSDVDAPVPTGSGSSKIPSLIKNYLSTVRLYCNDDCADIKDDIESFAEDEAALFIKRYMRNDETILPIGRLDHYCQELSMPRCVVAVGGMFPASFQRRCSLTRLMHGLFLSFPSAKTCLRSGYLKLSPFSNQATCPPGLVLSKACPCVN